jgi:type II secretory pathway pseudopilin PulG
MKLPNSKIAKSQNCSRGYILITLMLFFSLMMIALVAVLPQIELQIQRDREEEMVHRGTEYMRGIKKYYKKFGRYPTRIEELENTNQQRFLRKRYKDPMATKGDKEFKMVRQGDPALNMLGLGGIQALNQPALNQSGPGQPPTKQMPTVPTAGNTPATGQNSADQPPAADSGNADTAVDAKSAGSSNDSGSPGGQVFGGGPILGVASASKTKSIREFNKKNHYNDWLFVYDPNSDRGGLLKGPIQPDATRRSGMLNGATPPVPGPTIGNAPTGQPVQPQGGQPSPPDEQ